MDISLKYLHFNLLHNDKILVCQPDIEASWVGRGVIPPLQALLSAADPHRWVLLRIIQRIIPCITPPYLNHPSPLYYRGWPTYQLSTFQSHRRLKLEMKSARSCCIHEILSKRVKFPKKNLSRFQYPSLSPLVTYFNSLSYLTLEN